MRAWLHDNVETLVAIAIIVAIAWIFWRYR